ncbi:hypothetical protein [Amphritea japonica]|uniref:Transmembrane anchor protein n=1 Tax=Amphritea japonica ATCC BAA-1530 TaxID=1278309 RepID=A0A7R6ST38_9GAMM|nr:hypothetical protein [Amphritea japonica]BBB26265.1 conserved hypothetical protein [Amphritea japonica ATCC BAA-1530]
MHDISDLNQDTPPSTMTLIKATVLAAIAGIIILITTILPAEYGVDPTGLGEKLGLAKLHNEPVIESKDSVLLSAPSASSSGIPVPPIWISTTAYRSDEISLILQPGKGAEIKARMKVGESFVFNWKAEGGDLYFDMHGEKINAGDEFTSYWLERARSSASGAFEAPFEGTHGWYWQNNSSTPVTIHLETSGFYKELYKP